MANQFRVNRHDGYVWVNPRTNEPEPERELVSDTEPGFKGQRHKLVSLDQQWASIPAARIEKALAARRGKSTASPQRAAVQSEDIEAR